MTDFQITRLIQEGRLEDYSATDGELVGFLRKAVRAIEDAEAAISDEGALLRAYEAMFLCATAAMLNAGVRMRGSSEGHHNDLVLILRHLGRPEYTALGNRWERLRRIRNQAMYDQETVPDVAEVSEMRDLARALFAAVRAGIERGRPDVVDQLPTMPPPDAGGPAGRPI